MNDKAGEIRMRPKTAGDQVSAGRGGEHQAGGTYITPLGFCLSLVVLLKMKKLRGKDSVDGTHAGPRDLVGNLRRRGARASIQL